MKSEWKKIPIKDLCIGFYDGPHATPPKSDSGAVFLGIPNFSNCRLDLSNVRYISEDDLPRWTKRVTPQAHDIVFSYEATLNLYAIIPDGFHGCLGRRMALMRPDESKVNYKFLYYYMFSSEWREEIERHKVFGSTVDRIPLISFPSFMVNLPDMATQEYIANILSALDDKIAFNNKINENLEQQVTALFHQIFDESNSNRKHISANEYFDISIGKTPPRKESQWFSKNPSDCVWVSISDMGSCGLYIADSSEYITHEAVEKFNVKIVPDNTVILSFKLTVGRIAITDGCMTTNEAIAHFKTNEPRINEYLYCYLKNFNFQTMGSTSSIATAVNSKIIKGMPFIVPTDDELEKFHKISGPLFMMIKSNQRENKYLGELRDVLLPKLMSGEINMEDIEV